MFITVRKAKNVKKEIPKLPWSVEVRARGVEDITFARCSQGSDRETVTPGSCEALEQVRFRLDESLRTVNRMIDNLRFPCRVEISRIEGNVITLKEVKHYWSKVFLALPRVMTLRLLSAFVGIGEWYHQRRYYRKCLRESRLKHGYTRFQSLF
jgi:hypothetical protein